MVGETMTVSSRSHLVASDFFGYHRPSQCGLRIWLREQGVEEAPPSPYSEVLMRLGASTKRAIWRASRMRST